MVDLLAILPFYISTGVDLRSIRAIRMFRLFRVLKVVRYSAAIRRFHRALLIAKEEIVLFSLVAALLLYLSAVGIYYFENKAQPEVFCSVFHSLWWSLCTLTTVGYGDVYPVTTGGRIFTFFVLAIGLGIISVPAGLVASALSKARELEDNESAARAEQSRVQLHIIVQGNRNGTPQQEVRVFVVVEKGKRIVSCQTKDLAENRNSAHAVWPAAKGGQDAGMLYSICSIVHGCRGSNRHGLDMKQWTI